VLGLALLLALLGVKEDMGLYVCGLGLALLLRQSHRPLGWTLLALGAAWTWVTLAVALPHWGGDVAHYRFIGRWASWGSTPAAVLLGFLRDPLRLAARMFNRGCVALVLALSALPLAALAGPQAIAIALPWLLNASSDLTIQSGLGLYYGVPLLAFMLVAMVLGLRNRREAWPRNPRWVAVLAAWLVVANVMNLSFPHVPRERGRILAGIARLPADAPVTASSCFFPLLGYRRPAVLIRDLTPPATPYVLLMKGRGGWPLSREQSGAFESVCVHSGYARMWSIGEAELLGRVAEPPNGVATGGGR
jgi:hypothetical protein